MISDWGAERVPSEGLQGGRGVRSASGGGSKTTYLCQSQQVKTATVKEILYNGNWLLSLLKLMASHKLNYIWIFFRMFELDLIWEFQNDACFIQIFECHDLDPLNCSFIVFSLWRPALRNIYMLEFHPSLSIASRVPEALKYALQVSLRQPVQNGNNREVSTDK